ncbi:universal stress protein [Mycobacterium sp. pV006]|uniref:universal stress protein n=1 Tax=Mycobacterium sp. pV006 TaxID=3238983 RepID=UPI00351B4C62
MDTLSLVVAVAAVWLFTGLVTGLWLVRRGHSLWWIAIAMMLGPIFVPIAWERVERSGPRRTAPDHGAQPRTGAPRVVVGMDGSEQAQAALNAAQQLFGGTAELILAEVVSYEAGEDPRQTAVSAARDRLIAAVNTMPHAAAGQEVLVGAPAEALAELARQVDADVLVVGRRGRGLTRRLLGSVSSALLERAPVPVLIVDRHTALGDER